VCVVRQEEVEWVVVGHLGSLALQQQKQQQQQQESHVNNCRSLAAGDL
jgi:hypothetical protein